MAVQNQQPVKFSFTSSAGREFKGFWNGKIYGSKVYVTLSKQVGSDIKCSFDMSSHMCDAGTWDVSNAKEAFAYLASKGVAPFANYDFTTDGHRAFEK